MRRRIKMYLPMLKKTREEFERGFIASELVSLAEKANASSIKQKYVLKKKPWAITIELRRIRK